MLDSPAKRCFIPRENETSSSVHRLLECSSRSQVKLQNLDRCQKPPDLLVCLCDI